MNLTIIKSRTGLIYLAVGVLACSVFAAIGTANTQTPNFGILMAWLAFAVYVALFELSSVIKGTTKPAVVIAGGLGLIACFWVIGAVGSAVNYGAAFSLLPQAQGKFWWVLPVAVTLWTIREVLKRRKLGAH